VKEIWRLIHDNANILTSINGFLDLALEESDRARRYSHMMRAKKEIRRAIELNQHLRIAIEAKKRQYGEE
jgi:hypothetical protein